MRRCIDIPDTAISIAFNDTYVTIKPIDHSWIIEQLNRYNDVHDHSMHPDTATVFVLKQEGKVDIMTKLHLCDAIENILITHTGLVGKLSLNFIEAFKRIANYDECIVVYRSDKYSVCYHLKYDDSVNSSCGECLDKYFEALYKFKPRGMKNG